MRTILCVEPGRLDLLERAPPVQQPGEVLIRMRRVGLCGTDYHIYAGNQPFLSYPRVMGHELAGEVAAAPAGSALAVGERVTVNPYLACRRCIACRAGKPNCCTDIRVLGVHIDGGMCEWLSVPEAAVLPVGDLSLDQAAMVEFLSVGAHAVARAQIVPGTRALVVGAGPIGIAVALFARLDGARVTLVDTDAARLAKAAGAIGIDDTIVVDAALGEALAARTGGDFYERVFDATGNHRAMEAGFGYVAHGGSYVLVSVVKQAITFADPEFHKREMTLIGSRNALSADFARVMAAIRAGDVPTDALLTQRLTLEEAPERFPELLAAQSDVLKAMIAI